MYAVFVTGGKQYRASEGDVLRVEKIDGAEGDAVDFDKVLMITDGEEVKVGVPYLDGGSVRARVKSQGRHKKIKIIKFQRRKHSRKQMGHRQAFTELEITGISAG